MVKKRVLAFAITGVMAFSLTACAGTPASNGSASSAAKTEISADSQTPASEADTSAETTMAEDEETKENEESVPAPVTQLGRIEDTAEEMLPAHAYELAGIHEVDGRQGIAAENGNYYVSGSTTITHYDKDWNVVSEAEEPFAAFEAEVNHIGDIDVYNGEIYAGVEYFMDGKAKNIQIAIYDADTLKLVRTWPFAEDSGQTEVSGVAVDPDHECVWMCSWDGDESGRYLYRYDLRTGEYLGKHHIQAPPQWLQGIAYYDGCLYMTADDGTADLGEPDHVYRCKVDPEKTAFTVVLERTLDDVTLQGEIEGISFDKEKNQMLISYNRGARIVLGMPKGFYEGYDKEIHEIFGYNIERQRPAKEKR